MSKVKKNVYDFLRGSFLTDESSFKNWRIIIYIVALMLIMIYSSHSVEKKVILISDMNQLKRELREEHHDTETTLMRIKMESNIREKVEKLGLQQSQTPPKKIKVTIK